MIELIIDKIFFLFILIVIGFICGKSKLIDDDVNKGIAKLIFNLTLPLLIITTLNKIELTYQIFINSVLVFVLTYLSIAILYFTAKFFNLFNNDNHKAKTIFVLQSMFGNIVFLGFPIINSLFGEEGMLYAIIYQLANDSLLWSLGIYMLNKHKSPSLSDSLKHLVNPITFGFAIGIVLVAFNIKIPQIILYPISEIGHTTIALSMIYIGAMLSFSKILLIFKNKGIFLMSFNKLLFTPLIICMIMTLLLTFMGNAINEIAMSVIVLQVAMPSMTAVVIIARQFDADDNQATINVFITTLLSLITLPIIWLMINKILL